LVSPGAIAQGIRADSYLSENVLGGIRAIKNLGIHAGITGHGMVLKKS